MRHIEIRNKGQIARQKTRQIEIPNTGQIEVHNMRHIEIRNKGQIARQNFIKSQVFQINFRHKY
jgi:hypothetical protein